MKNSSTIMDAFEAQDEKFEEIKQLSSTIHILDYKFKNIGGQIKTIYDICFKNFLYKNIMVGKMEDIYDNGDVKEDAITLYLCKSGFKTLDSSYRSKKPKNINDWRGDIFVKYLKLIAQKKIEFSKHLINPTKKDLFLNFLANLEEIPYLKDILLDLSPFNIIKSDIKQRRRIRNLELNNELELTIEGSILKKDSDWDIEAHDNITIRLRETMDFEDKIILEQLYEQVTKMLYEALKNREERIDKIQKYLDYLKIAMMDYLTIEELKKG